MPRCDQKVFEKEKLRCAFEANHPILPIPANGIRNHNDLFAESTCVGALVSDAADQRSARRATKQVRLPRHLQGERACKYARKGGGLR